MEVNFSETNGTLIFKVSVMHIRRQKYKYLKGIDGRPYIVAMYEHQEFY